MFNIAASPASIMLNIVQKVNDYFRKQRMIQTAKSRSPGLCADLAEGAPAVINVLPFPAVQSSSAQSCMDSTLCFTILPSSAAMSKSYSCP